MKQLMVDLIGLAGFSALTAGVYLEFGAGLALITGGVLGLVGATIASRSGR